MNAFYMESSALLAKLLNEPPAHAITLMLSKAELVAASTLTLLETRRACCRLRALQKISAAGEQELLGLLEEYAREWNIREISPTIQTRAGERFPVEPVRSLDAIHLATILELIQVYPDLRVLSFDDRVLDNLTPLGLKRAK